MPDIYLALSLQLLCIINPVRLWNFLSEYSVQLSVLYIIYQQSIINIKTILTLKLKSGYFSNKSPRFALEFY